MSWKKSLKNTCCWRFLNTKPGRFCKFFFLLFLDLIDLGVDWYFYAKLNIAEPGLVYGPPEPRIEWTTLAFCVVATVCLFIETAQNADDLFAKKKIPFLTQSLSNFICIAFQDIPLLVLNLIFVICRDGNPTLINVIKASVCIAIVIIRFVLMILFYWFLDNRKSRFNSFMDAFSTAGLFVVAAISITIQLLNNFPTNSKGLIQISDPANFDIMNYVRSKYLEGVSIYARWPVDDKELNGTSNNYIWLADITDVIDFTEMNIQIKTDYATPSRSNQYTMCFVKPSLASSSMNKTTTCYSISRASNQAIQISPSIVDLSPTSFLGNSGFDITLTKEPAQGYKYLVGYIDYNVYQYVTSESNNDRTGSSFNYEINRKCSVVSTSSLIYAAFHTVGTKPSFLRNNTANSFSFYDLSTDLTTVDQIWRTGIVGCKHSGDLGPKLNSELRGSITC